MSPSEVEALAENLAAQGREELLSRFRDAYAKALGAHADLVSFDADRVDAMVQRSAAEADGLQWRRALAGVAARELNISLASALTHPAVVRAHQIVGAPSYESALAALAVPVPPVAAPAVRTPESEPEPEPEPEPVEAATPAPAPVAEPAQAEAAAPVQPEVEAPVEPELEAPAAPAAEPEEDIPADPELEQAAEAELAMVIPESGHESEPELPASGPEALSDHPGDALLDPTVAMDALAPDAPPEPAPVDTDVQAEPEAAAPEADAEPEAAAPEADAEPEAPVTDDVLAHRAAEFAEEFLAGGGPAAILAGDDYTFEHDAIGGDDLVDLDGADGAADADEAHFRATHLGGVATLPSAEEIDVRISGDGLDLMHEDGTIVGRLGWPDIAALEVTVPHGRRRRRGAPRLIVHTAGGSARFEVPELSGEELQGQVQPLMARYGH